MVRRVHELHDHILGSHILEALHVLAIAGLYAAGDIAQRTLAGRPGGVIRRRRATKVLGAHVKGTTHEVTPAVGEVRVIDLLHTGEADGTVLARYDVTHEVVAVALHAQKVDDLLGGDGVPTRLAHLLALTGLIVPNHQEAVGKDVLRQGLAYGHEHGGPDDAVEADDVLAHDVVLGRPAPRELSCGTLSRLAIAYGRHVVEQRVEPHVGHVALIKGQAYAPVKARAAHGEVLKAPFHEALDLVHPKAGHHEVGMLLVESKQPVLKGGESEKPGLLLHARKGSATVGAEVLALAVAFLVGLVHLVLGEVGLVGDAVPAVIGALVDIARLPHALPEVADGTQLARLGGTDKVIVGYLERLPELLEGRHLAVTPLLWSHAVLARSLLDLLAMLVHTREKLDIKALGATVARLHVTEDCGVRGPQVWLCVDVVDGCGDVEAGPTVAAARASQGDVCHVPLS